MTQYIQVVTTTETKDDAETIAHRLLDLRLAACIQIAGPISSSYWWQGKREESREWQCVIKTRDDLYLPVEREIKAAHPYLTPEIIALPISKGSPDYLAWLEAELSGGQTE